MICYDKYLTWCLQASGVLRGFTDTNEFPDVRPALLASLSEIEGPGPMMSRLALIASSVVLGLAGLGAVFAPQELLATLGVGVEMPLPVLV